MVANISEVVVGTNLDDDPILVLAQDIEDLVIVLGVEKILGIFDKLGSRVNVIRDQELS